MGMSLTPELQAIVQTQVSTGHYSSATDVIREALNLMIDRDAFESLRHDDTRLKISSGFASLLAGRSKDGESVFEEIDKEMDELDSLER